MKELIGSLVDEQAAEVVAAMREVREEGLTAARKLRGDIWARAGAGVTLSEGWIAMIRQRTSGARLRGAVRKQWRRI